MPAGIVIDILRGSPGDIHRGIPGGMLEKLLKEFLE